MTIQDTDKFLVHRNGTSYYMSALDFKNSFDFIHSHKPEYLLKGGLRLRGTNNYLSRTPSVQGNKRTFTISLWVKRGLLDSSEKTIISAGDRNPSVNGMLLVNWTPNSQLRFYGDNINVTTTAVYRDPSAWYHIVVAVDTTQATASNRIKIYVNGSQVTALATANYPSQNYEFHWNATMPHEISRWAYSQSQYGEQYFSEVNSIDGQALTPDSFGYREEHGYWYPKEYVGDYGTNGFYLDFNGNTNSPNGNNWTPNNIATDDYVKDSATDNFATLNPLNKGTVIVLEEGNLTSHSGGGGWTSASSTLGVSSGKWYWETKLTSSGNSGNWRHGCVGISSKPNDIKDSYVGNVSSIGYHAYTGQKWKNNVPENYATTLDNGSILGTALDLDNGTIEFYKDGVSLGVAYSDIEPNLYFPTVSHESICYLYSNFGQQPFAHTPPDGFKALSTLNLIEPNVTPSENFNTVIYSGNGSASQSITGVGFKPDFVWIKGRNVVNGHGLYDSVRGAGKRLLSHLTNAEDTVTGVLSFDTDGFTLSTTYNTSTENYVAWCWKAGESAVTNNDGSIESTVNANPDNGFSIVDFAGTGVAGTVGHGLNKAPSIIITKTRGTTTNPEWHVYHKDLGAGNKLFLNTNDAMSATSAWNSTEPTDKVFSMRANAMNVVGVNTINYCWAEVEGFSKFGSYTGNGSTDGTFVYTGFRPALIIAKRTNNTSGWAMIDTARDTYNQATYTLQGESSNAEYTTGLKLDILSNGFKHRETNHNASGGSFIYMAFAEKPINYTKAR